ncbi:hypothetical protein M9H77_23816 [Catharanthus roseus]|uniref:Uncharacterized protein n=1 Tax=Catharanthus roseus TaxID=4058 RepID=A0ACC0AYH9_CATRO|nr:hypothetical protein M9H77_23816 [Catharanthus roseus]
MEYNWSNPSWKRIKVKSKQEDYPSKLTRDFHRGSGNRFNAYGGNNRGNGYFTSRRHVGVGNFSSYDKSSGYTSYDYYGGHGRVNAKYEYYERSPYDCYEEYHHSYGGKSAKSNKLSQAQDVIDIKVIHHEKKNTCTFVKEEK